ncbi:MAG: hypothetical protein MJ225_03025 [Bacilli bacterium]|nr:hypothetical protein [Bacilli bacterium]
MSKARLMLDNRINLQAAINKNYSLEECSILLKKSRSTIYREIINNSYYKQCRHTCSHCSKSCPVLKPFVKGECKNFMLIDANDGRNSLIHAMDVNIVNFAHI